MIGVIIPAHNEEHHLGIALQAIDVARRDPCLQGEAVEVIVVLDSCTDGTASVAARHGAATATVGARNVGTARAHGATAMLAVGARWLAFTDADTTVAPNWLSAQLALNADAVCGAVNVADWSPHGEHAALIEAHFQETYTDREGHRHIHGANLGVSAQAYLRAGGFRALACSEDVDLVEALERSGARIAWSAAPRVLTSARKDVRAKGGFGDALIKAVAARLAALPVVVSPSC
ncbi:glycosyltransferase [Variovorax sp. J22R133]|uniref:glycosyltransferase n=1 Tax=Variovorax brevis TaxID=3053503 RepID=UPI002577D19D|nr:glycosyltransferase [Variovorax sp. J22R133]MDM0114036.1 glycosyltransferase [Variovorax sp. J22R133]